MTDYKEEAERIHKVGQRIISEGRAKEFLQGIGLVDYKVCPECGKKKKTVEQRRQNTRYTNDELNYVVMCKGCFKERQEYWKMMWEHVYG